VRLLATALKVIGDRPIFSAGCASDRSCCPNFSRSACGSKPGERATSDCRGCQHQSASRPWRGLHGDGDQRGRQPRPAPLRRSRHASIPNARTRASTWRSAAASTAAPARRWHARRRGSDWNGCWTAPPTSGSARPSRPAGDRRYQYIPTYILRGLTELHLEFDSEGVMKVTSTRTAAAATACA
jgi:hypothetical protein